MIHPVAKRGRNTDVITNSLGSGEPSNSRDSVGKSLLQCFTSKTVDGILY